MLPPLHALESMPKAGRDQQLGSAIYPRVVSLVGTGLASKVTGMLLQMPTADLLTLLTNQNALRAAVDKAVGVLPPALVAAAVGRSMQPRGPAPSPMSGVSMPTLPMPTDLEGDAAAEGSTFLPTSEERQLSSSMQCGVCLEPIVARRKRFGLLEGCDHPFCIECLREWRSTHAIRPDVARACPQCRIPSHFIVPSSVHTTGQRKAALTKAYLSKLKAVPCKYFRHGLGTCPFGTSCFYAHTDPLGRPIKVEPRKAVGADGQTNNLPTYRLSEYLFPETIDGPQGTDALLAMIPYARDDPVEISEAESSAAAQASSEASPSAPPAVVAAFSGQGIPSGQLAELRRVARVPSVSGFLRRLSESLDASLAKLPLCQRAEHFPHGLDIAAWASSSAANGPPIDYVNSTSVTLVLTFAIQLAAFRYAWGKEGAYPALPTVGHSQGLAAAMVVALSSCDDSFSANASIFADVLLHIGLAIAERVPQAASYALAVLKLPTEDVQALVNDADPPVYLVVKNGACACTITGAPDALDAFESRLPSSAALKRLPVCAPFHCPPLLNGACDSCFKSLKLGTATIAASALRRPCWSCVDGSDLSGNAINSLQAYLISALTTWPVDWPSTVRSIAGSAAVTIVDFGPGGGSGVARMSTVVAEEEGLAHSVKALYWTQHYCGAPGPLPQSWLSWIKSKEEGDEDDDNDAVSLEPEPDVAACTSKGKDFVFFSERLKKASNNATSIVFTPEVLQAIEPELEKVRVGRRQAMQRPLPEAVRSILDGEAYASLRKETILTFDTSVYPLASSFSALLGLPDGLPLHRLHEAYHADRGRKGARSEKATLLAPLTDADKRAEFTALYERLIVEVLAPRLHAAIGCERVVFQSFPCVRVHRPGEFSIGPHCDAQYQAPEVNLNFYVPLTKEIWGTNSLYLESEPGKEDWHPLELKYGELTTFCGVHCSHFTAENTTDISRVSLDFRLIPGCCYEVEPEQQPKDFRVGEYYSECALVVDGEAPPRFEVGRRGAPYWRHGFPFVNK